MLPKRDCDIGRIHLASDDDSVVETHQETIPIPIPILVGMAVKPVATSLTILRLRTVCRHFSIYSGERQNKAHGQNAYGEYCRHKWSACASKNRYFDYR